MRLAALLVLATLWPSTVRAFEYATPMGKWTIGGYGELYSVFRTNHNTQAQRPAGITSLSVTGDLHPKVRVFLSGQFMAGGWPEDAKGFDLYNISDTFQNISPSTEVEEGYVDLFLGPVDLRLGKQKFAWGKLDTFQPTDVLNTRWYNDPFLTDEQDAKIGVPAARAAWYVPALGAHLPQDMSATLVWIPVPVSTRFPVQTERWFPPAIEVAQAIDVGRTEALPTNPIRVANSVQEENVTPTHQLDQGAVGLRLAGLWGPVDWDLYYYNGIETDPVLAFSPTLVYPAARRAKRRGDPLPVVPPPNTVLQLAADSSLTPRFERIQLFGADGSYELAGFTMRAEVAYGQDRLLPRSVQELVSKSNVLHSIGGLANQQALAAKLGFGERVPLDLGDLFATSDTVEWGVGVDYMVGSWMPLLQVNQTIVLDDVPTLLIDDVDTQFLLALRRAFFEERLGTELAVIQSVSRGYTVGIVRGAYDVTDHLRVRAGYMLLAGSRNSLYGQFHSNDEAFLRIRYSF
jgi:hypothetical protein